MFYSPGILWMSISFLVTNALLIPIFLRSVYFNGINVLVKTSVFIWKSINFYIINETYIVLLCKFLYFIWQKIGSRMEQIGYNHYMRTFVDDSQFLFFFVDS